MILFDANKCVSCNSCIRACPTPEANMAVQTEDGRTVYNIDPDKCIRCGACVKVCPEHALKLVEHDASNLVVVDPEASGTTSKAESRSYCWSRRQSRWRSTAAGATCWNSCAATA